MPTWKGCKCVGARSLAKITESFPKEISAPVEGPVSPASRDVGRALSCPRIAADQPKMQNSLTEQRAAYSLYPDKSDILQPCLEKSATSTPTARIRPKIRVFERLPSVSKAGKMLVAHAASGPAERWHQSLKGRGVFLLRCQTFLVFFIHR